MPYVTKPFAGYVVIKKTAGNGPVANGTQAVIPIVSSQPRDPKNNQYPTVVNKTANPSTIILGKRTPSISFSTYLKSSWPAAFETSPGAGDGLANFLSSLIKDTGNPTDLTGVTNWETDEYAILLNDGTQGGTWSSRIFDGCKCQQMTISCNSQGGGINMELSFLAASASGATSFNVASINPDAGYFYDTSDIDFGGLFTLNVGNGLYYGISGSATADLVRAFRLNLLRGQAYNMFFNGTLNPAGVSSGMFGGTLQIEQSPLYTHSPSSQFTARIYNSSASGGSPQRDLTIACVINNDEDVLDETTQFGNLIRTYTLIDSSTGGDPAAFS